MAQIQTILGGIFSFISTQIFSPWSYHNVAIQMLPSSYLKDIVSSFLTGLDYQQPDSDMERRACLQQDLRREFTTENTAAVWVDAICEQASAMAVFCYPNHSAEVQLQIARFTWYMLYFDDLCHKFPQSLERFQRSIFANQGTQEKSLSEFRSHLTDMYKFWDLIPANFIIVSAMEYLNGCALEEMKQIKVMRILDTAQSWPYYLRSKTGVAAAYAFMIFPREINPDISSFIQVIGDISLFIDLTNDVLSFHKEHLAGETNNYVHNRAQVTGKSVGETLQDVASDALAAHARITRTLQSTKERTLWKHFVRGYLAFHVTQKRYRLNDLAL